MAKRDKDIIEAVINEWMRVTGGSVNTETIHYMVKMLMAEHGEKVTVDGVIDALTGLSDRAIKVAIDLAKAS